MILIEIEKLIDETVLRLEEKGAKYCYFFVDLVEFP